MATKRMPYVEPENFFSDEDMKAAKIGPYSELAKKQAEEEEAERKRAGKKLRKFVNE